MQKDPSVIALSLSLPNPFPTISGEGMPILAAGASISTHKAIFLDIATGPALSLASVHLDLSWTGQHHAGPKFSLSVWGLSLAFGLADDRHWDYETGRWGAVCEGHDG